MATSNAVLPHELSQQSAAGLEETASEQLPEWGSGEPDWLVQVTGGCGPAGCVPAGAATAAAAAAAAAQLATSNGTVSRAGNSNSVLTPAPATGQVPGGSGSEQDSTGQQPAQQLHRTSTAGTSSSNISSGSHGGVTSGSSSMATSSTLGFSHLGLAALARQDEMLRWGSAAVDSTAASARSSSIACQQPHVEHVEEAAPPPYQPLTLVDDGAGRGRSSTSCPKQVPALDLSKLKPGSNAPAIYSRNMNSSVAAQPPSRREVTMCLDTGPAAPLAAGAPVNDNRCYVYGAVSGQDLAALTGLLSRLASPRDAAAVQALWDALLVARRDAEAVAARGARIARDVSRDWQETVTDLIDRIVAQDGEIASLKAKMSTMTSSSSVRGAASSSGPMDPAMEELAAQVGRLKKQRDKAVREAAELAAGLEAARSQAAAARSAATAAQEELALVYQKHQQLQQQHDIGNKYARQLRAYVSALEEQLAALTSSGAAAAPAATGTSSLSAAGAAAGVMGAGDRLSAASVAAAAAAAISGGYLAGPTYHHHLVSASSPLQRRSSPRAGSPRAGQLPRSSPRAGNAFAPSSLAPAAGSASKLGAVGTRDRSSKADGGRPDTPNRGDRAASTSHVPPGPLRSNTYEFDRCDQIDQEPGPGMAPASVHKFTRMQQQRPSTPDYLAGPSA